MYSVREYNINKKIPFNNFISKLLWQLDSLFLKICDDKIEQLAQRLARPFRS